MSGRAAAAALAVALGLAGCAVQRPWGYQVALAAGDRAYSANRWREAARAYDAAAERTHRPRDRDEAVYRAGQAYRRAGDVATALARFDWLAAHGDADARGPRGALAALELRFARGDATRARADALALARRYPETGAGRRAVAVALFDLDARDPSGSLALAWLARASATELARTEIGPALNVMRAERLAEAGRAADAEAAFEAALAVPYPGNSRWDDGGLRFARFLLAQRRPADAVRVIDRVLAVHEDAVMRPGSYTRPHFPELALLRARILRDELGDAGAAADAFHAVYTTFPTSLLRDNALYEEATLRASRGESARACGLYAVLAREFPCTRFGRRGADAAVQTCGRARLAERAPRCSERGRGP